MAIDLDNYRKGRPLLARPPGFFERIRRVTKRNMKVTVAVCVTATLLAGGAVPLAAKWGDARLAEAEALAAEKAAEEVEAEAERRQMQRRRQRRRRRRRRRSTPPTEVAL